MTDFTDDELDELSNVILERIVYGPDEVVYRTTEEGDIEHDRLASALRKVNDEAKARRLWWAR